MIPIFMIAREWTFEDTMGPVRFIRSMERTRVQEIVRFSFFVFSQAYTAIPALPWLELEMTRKRLVETSTGLVFTNDRFSGPCSCEVDSVHVR